MRSTDDSRAHRRRRLMREEHAATLVFMALMGGVLLGATALAVDLGMLITARVQSQRAADSGALAGALRYATIGATEADARAEAKEFANSHSVLTNSVTVEDADVDVVGDTVRVRVHHTIGTLFARVIGVDEVDVSTVAAAEAVPAGGAVCPLPIVAVDRWHDEVALGGDGDGLYDDGETYVKCTGDNPKECTGYDITDDVGVLIEAKSQNTSEPSDSTAMTCGAEDPSWYCWIDDLSSGGGSADLVDAIKGCQNTDYTIAIGDTVWSKAGNNQNVVNEAKKYIDAHDTPQLSWNSSVPCVSDGTDCVDTHPRIRSLAIVDPTTISEESGSNAHAVVNNLASVYMEKVASDDTKPHGQDPPPGQWNLYLRFHGSAQGGTGRGGTEGQLLKTIVLVE